MPFNRRSFLQCLAATAAAPSLRSHAFQQSNSTQSASPEAIPDAERRLPTIRPEPWLQIDPGNVFLKGMAFDRRGDLTVIAAYPGQADKGLAGRLDRALIRITPQKSVSTILRRTGYRFCDHAIHKDGRIFIACLTGELLTVNPDGSNLAPVPVKVDDKPQSLSDLTFDSHGALCVTDFTGKPGKPTGGVYRYSPDLAGVAAFGPPLVTPNGVAFTRDERTLWVTCSMDKRHDRQFPCLELAFADHRFESVVSGLRPAEIQFHQLRPDTAVLHARRHGRVGKVGAKRRHIGSG